MLEQVQCLSLRGSRDHLCSFAGLLGCAGDSVLHAMERVVYPTGSGFPQCQRPEVQVHGMGRAGVILRPVHSDLLCMSSHGRPSVYVCILISCPSKDSEPHTCHMTSQYLHELCFFKKSLFYKPSSILSTMVICRCRKRRAGGCNGWVFRWTQLRPLLPHQGTSVKLREQQAVHGLTQLGMQSRRDVRCYSSLGSALCSVSSSLLSVNCPHFPFPSMHLACPHAEQQQGLATFQGKHWPV